MKLDECEGHEIVRSLLTKGKREKAKYVHLENPYLFISYTCTWAGALGPNKVHNGFKKKQKHD